MPKKLTIGFVREQFEKEGYILLTKTYENNKQELEYICPIGHLSHITFHSWRAGMRCWRCSGKKKLTLSFVKKQIEKENYKLLTDEYVGSQQHLQVMCPKGHIYSVKYNKWQSGRRCPRCRYDGMLGKNNPNWNSNLTEKDRVDRRYIPEHKKWSYEVKERDGFICQVCGQLRGEIESHHLESYNNNPDLRTALDNGVCLCEKCHKDFHHQCGYGNNTKEQFEDFVSNCSRIMAVN